MIDQLLNEPKTNKLPFLFFLYSAASSIHFHFLFFIYRAHPGGAKCEARIINATKQKAKKAESGKADKSHTTKGRGEKEEQKEEKEEEAKRETPLLETVKLVRFA